MISVRGDGVPEFLHERESFWLLRRDSYVVGPDRHSDAELLIAVASRDLEAMRELYDRHAAWLSVRLARRCSDREVVADALQDTFVAVWQKPATFRGQGDVAAR